MKNFKDNSKIRFNKISTEKCFMFNGARIWRGIEHIKSVSVYETEVFIIELLPGQVLENVTTVHDENNPIVAGPNGAVVLCDRLGYDTESGRFTTTKDRQTLQLRYQGDGWYRDSVIDASDWLRCHCLQRGASVVRVPGEVIPLCYADEVLVPAFRMSGTEYYRMPRNAYERYLVPFLRKQDIETGFFLERYA